MDEEIRVMMVGNLEQISVGGLCEIVKQNMSEVLFASNVGECAIYSNRKLGLPA